ncbi:MAG: tetratricopeptide repeat protein [Woeseiaceae bacterium]
MKKIRAALVFAGIISMQVALAQNLPSVPDGVQAVSLSGKPLYASPPNEKVIAALASAKQTYDENPDDADNIIWFGRRIAYTGDYRRAIDIFSEGIEKFPDDARMYRHRGHRYVSIREFDRAIADLERASELIEGTANETEPDGAPNALNIPVSSLHGNIWYHLGLAYYLKHDWDNAYRAYKNGFDAGRNDDNRVSTTHWLYMILQRKGDPEAAARVLDVISADMNVIENMSYHNLCLFYKGEQTMSELIGENEDSPAGAAIMYGAANWHFYNDNVEKAREMYESMTATDGWSAFGVIAAEADLALIDN